MKTKISILMYLAGCLGKAKKKGNIAEIRRTERAFEDYKSHIKKSDGLVMYYGKIKKLL